VIFFRAILIGLGAALVYQFSWILFLFGAFLVFTGIRMFRHQDDEPDIESQSRLQIPDEALPRHQGTSRPGVHRQAADPKTGKLVTWLTPLAVALVMVETVDLIFAVDSVPAVFAVTQDTFIVYTSNIFAILGLRALYFALAAAMNRFRYLQTSLAIILVLVGIKIFLVPVGIKIDTLLSLLVTLAILAGGVIYSLYEDAQRAGHQRRRGTQDRAAGAIRRAQSSPASLLLTSPAATASCFSRWRRTMGPNCSGYFDLMPTVISEPSPEGEMSTG
jgi:tellurite resistance protein TerC